MPEWEYLATEVFKTRNVLAANLLKGNAKIIVDIGGYRTPIWDFLWPVHSGYYDRIFVIDPKLDRERDDKIRGWFGIKQPFQDCLDLLPESDFGLVALGMEIKGDFNPFIELVDRSELTIVEFPVGWEPSKQQFERIMTESNKHIHMQIGLDFSGNDFSECRGYPVRPHRVMYVLRGT